MSNIVGNYFRPAPLTKTRACRERPRPLRLSPGTAAGSWGFAASRPQRPGRPLATHCSVSVRRTSRAGGTGCRIRWEDHGCCADPEVPTLLVKIFGKDRPGITAGLFDTLAAYSVDVVDIEQVVTRGRLVLCALVSQPPAGIEGDLRAPCTAGPSR